MSLFPWLGLVGWLFLIAFFSGTETGYYVISRVRLAIRVAAREASALRVQRQMRYPFLLLGTLLVGNNLAAFMASSYSMRILETLLPQWSKYGIMLALLNTLILSPVILLFCEMVPKNLFRRCADDYVPRVSLVTAAFKILFLPATLAVNAAAWVLQRALRQERSPRLELLTMRAMEAHLLEGTQAGALSLEQDRIARNILGLARKTVGEVMVPLPEAVMLPENVSEEEFRRTVAQHGYSRYPVYRERRENIVGILNALDILYSDKPFAVAPHLRQPTRVSAPEPIDGALLEMRAARKPMGVVIGSGGRAVGIFTMKDLVEEIVGELREW